MLFNQCVFKIQTVGLTVKMDALMYMHHSGQFFDTDNIGTKVLITTNETIFLDVQFAKRIKLESEKQTINHFYLIKFVSFCLAYVNNQNIDFTDQIYYFNLICEFILRFFDKNKKKKLYRVAASLILGLVKIIMNL